MQAQVLRELALPPEQALVVKVNVDEQPELASRFGVQSIPTMLVFREGQLQQRHVGLADADQVRDLLGL